MIQGLHAGACGYLLKDVDLDTLLHAIRRAAQGETVLPPDVKERLLAYAARGLQPSQRVPRQGVLTEREKEVLLVLSSLANSPRNAPCSAHRLIAFRPQTDDRPPAIGHALL